MAAAQVALKILLAWTNSVAIAISDIKQCTLQHLKESVNLF
jgi:hypothetical protein